MKNTRSLQSLFASFAVLTLSVAAFGQDAKTAPNASAKAQTATIAAGQKQKISGVIVSREADRIVVRDMAGMDVPVTLTNATKMTERKGNPFRKAKTYPATALLRGLEVEVEGRGDEIGRAHV